MGQTYLAHLVAGSGDLGSVGRMLNRVTQLLGVEHPIIQAPMGYIARAQLASAVSNAGALGIIETSSGRLDEVREEIAKMRDLTDKPFGVNIAQAFVRDPTSSTSCTTRACGSRRRRPGTRRRYTDALHDAGITVFHVVPNLHSAHEGDRRRRRRHRRRRRRGRRLQEPRATWRRWCCCRWCARRSTSR